MTWIWVVSFGVLGSATENGTFGAFETKTQCELALQQRQSEMRTRGRIMVGTCYVTQRKM